MAKKISLREYQEGVLAKLKSTLASPAAAASKLGLQIGDGYWLIDLQDVSEVVPVPEMAPVPLTYSWFRGVSNVRGNLYSVVDLPLFFSGVVTQPNSSNRLLLVNARLLANSALIVTRMLGLRNASQLKALPLPADHEPWHSGCYEDVDGRIWNVLDMTMLTTHPQFLQVATA